MRDKILRLLDSPNTEDVILGIHLAIKNLNNCEDLFLRRELPHNHGADYMFRINGKIHIFFEDHIWREHPNNLNWEIKDFTDGEITFD